MEPPVLNYPYMLLKMIMDPPLMVQYAIMCILHVIHTSWLFTILS